jgi:hypothetical protein
MRPLTQRIVIALFALVCAGPLVAYGVGAGTPSSIENRQLAPIPSPSVADLLRIRTYDRLALAISDRLPLRNQAIEANSWIDLKIFRRSPNPQVIIGSHNWLYYSPGVNGRCLVSAELAEIQANWATMDQLLRAHGKRLSLIVVPSKETVYPRFLPKRDQAGCGPLNTPLIQGALAGLPGPGFGPLDRTDQRLRYYKNDTHWDTLGASLGAERVVDEIQPGLWDPSALVRSASIDHHIGDLTLLLGLGQPEDTDLYEVRRPGIVVTSSQAGGFGPESIHETRSGGALVAGRVAVLHDSFGDALRSELSPYFADATWVKTSRTDTTAGIVQAMKEANIVVVVVVERSVLGASAQLVADAQAAFPAG